MSSTQQTSDRLDRLPLTHVTSKVLRKGFSDHRASGYLGNLRIEVRPRRGRSAHVLKAVDRLRRVTENRESARHSFDERQDELGTLSDEVLDLIDEKVAYEP